jgi:hypothetical protein
MSERKNIGPTYEQMVQARNNIPLEFLPMGSAIQPIWNEQTRETVLALRVYLNKPLTRRASVVLTASLIGRLPEGSQITTKVMDRIVSASQ